MSVWLCCRGHDHQWHSQQQTSRQSVKSNLSTLTGKQQSTHITAYVCTQWSATILMSSLGLILWRTGVSLGEKNILATLLWMGLGGTTHFFVWSHFSVGSEVCCSCYHGIQYWDFSHKHYSCHDASGGEEWVSAVSEERRQRRWWGRQRSGDGETEMEKWRDGGKTDKGVNSAGGNAEEGEEKALTAVGCLSALAF